MKKLLTITAAALLLAGCSHNEKLTVINQSPTTLTNVVAAGPGMFEHFGTLAPGAQGQVTVDPTPNDPAGFRLEFDADGKHYTNNVPNTIWNGMKEVVLTVQTNFSVDLSAVTTF